MKLAAILLIALAGLTVADEVRPDAAMIREVGPTPRLGLTVGRIDEAIRAHVPQLPEGIGFVVTSVDADGAAEKAGLQSYDIFWKFDDQLIANEAQLLTLLRLRRVGEKVPLGIYRRGKELTLTVELESLPEKPALARIDGPAGVPDAPMKVLNPAARTAEIELPDGKAVLSLVAGIAEVKIVSSDGAPVFEGPVYDLDGTCLVPDPWKPRVGALERALAHAMKGNPAPPARIMPARKHTAE